MTAAFESIGIVKAWGNVGESLGSTIAWTQRLSGDESTFGVKLKTSGAVDTVGDKSIYLLGRLNERGCFNYRWPFHEYALVHEKNGPQLGTCALFSFVKDGVLYQIIHLEEDHRDTLGKRNIVLRISSPSKFRPIYSEDYKTAPIGVDSRLPRPGSRKGYAIDLDIFQPESDEAYTRVSSHTAKIKPDPDRPGSWSIDSFSEEVTICLPDTMPVTLVSSMRLRETATAQPAMPPTSEAIHQWIGIDPLNIWATGAMWETIFLRREAATYTVSELSEVNLIARCLEKIVHVDIVPRKLIGADSEPMERQPLAILSNTFLRAEVDMEALL